MLSMNTILVPVDFSEPSRKAVSYGLSLALELEATLVLVHIVPAPGALNYTFPLEERTLPDGFVEETRDKLRDLVDAGSSNEIKHREIVVAGDVEHKLLSLIESESPDLVVMGTHGRRPFERWFLGSLTERILRKVSAPIMTISHLDRSYAIDKPHPARMERILYATDLSSVSERAVEVAAAFAERFDAQLHVVHVNRPLPGYAESEVVPSSKDDQKIAEHLVKRVVESVPEPIRSRPNVTITTLEGYPYEALLGYVDEHAIDMIVLNTQSRPGLDRALLGSVAERIVRGAHVPVLSIPPVESSQPVPLLLGPRS